MWLYQILVLLQKQLLICPQMLIFILFIYFLFLSFFGVGGGGGGV